MEKRKTPMGFLNATKFETELMCNDKSSSTYLVEKERFMKDLLQFHTQRGLSLHRIPRLNGKSLDLYNLYLSVTRNGGWEKVTNEEKWSEVMASLDLNKSCGNADFALRQIYIKYLHHYEKVHFFGQEVDIRDEQNEPEEGSRRKTNYHVGGVTFSYNHQQHNISDATRESLGITRDANLHFNSNYSSLEKSLASGLPNEIDFAINVCLLLSNDTKHVLKGPKSLKVVELLLSHVGIFKQGPCAYVWDFENDTNLNFEEFWNETVREKEVLQLMHPDNLMHDKAVELNPQSEEDLYFCQRRQLGLRDREGQRVMQVAHIVRNFLVEDENVEILASSTTLFRFLVLCTYNNLGSIRQLGLDGLSYLASKLILDPVECRMMRSTLQLISRCVLSMDKFEVIRGCDLIAQLSLCNEDDLSIDESLYPVLIRLLTIHDIELLLASLEALYQLSENGHVPCNAIVAVHKSIDTLLGLLTIDAQKQLLTPDSLECGVQPEPILSPILTFNPIFHQIILPGNMVTNVAGSQNVIQTAFILPTNNVVTNSNVSNVPVIVSATNATPPMNLPIVNATLSVNAMTNGTPATTSSNSIATPPPEDPVVIKPPEPVPPQTTLLIAHFTENEKTAFNWLTSQYEFVSDSEVGLSKMEMFRKYISESSVHGLQKVVSPTSFENCIKAAFPHSKIVSKNNSMNVSFCGIVKKVSQAPKPSATPSFPAIEQVLNQKTSSTNEILLDGLDKDLVSVAADIGIEIVSDLPTKDLQVPMEMNPTMANPSPSLGQSVQQAFSGTPSTGLSLPIGVGTQQLQQKQLVLQKIMPSLQSQVANSITTSLIQNLPAANQAGGQTTQPLQQQQTLNANIINSVLVQQSRLHTAATNSGGLSVLQAQLLKQAIDAQRLASPGSDSKSPLLPASPPPSDPKKRKLVTPGSPLVRQIKKKRDEMNGPVKYYCEWTGCEGLVFDKFSAIYQHVVKQHFEKHCGEGTMVCMWSGCDGMPRQKWSFMAHMLERHINENMLRVWSTKHVEPSTCIPIHPPSTMYPPNAALQAIRRFSARPPFAEFMDAKEESTSKHIHLTAALILRNLARYSAQARSLIKKHESRVACLAFSDTESSSALSNCLYELHHFKN